MRGALVRTPFLAAAALLIVASPALAARGFRHGVAAGEVTSKSAVLWAHASRSGLYLAEVATDRRFRKDAGLRDVRAVARNDNTVQTKVGRLRPGTRYWYRFRGAHGRRRSAVGTFVTAPRPGRNATVEFGWTGDTAA
jgi:alkaline phosphatase D